jgi:poly(ADP-ribose) polymerase-like protein
VAHTIEPARSGRAKCRGCGQTIASGALRFGERVPNVFADDGGETTHWFHVACAAFMRPEAFLETLPSTSETVDDRERLEREAQRGITCRRLPRVTSVGRAPSGRAACRSCHEPIPKDEWRISLVYYEEGRFVPSGFIHLACVRAYIETTDILDRLKYFSPGLTETDVNEIRQRLEGDTHAAQNGRT